MMISTEAAPVFVATRFYAFYQIISNIAILSCPSLV